MDRRTVLRSTSALATAATVGLAGCNGILGGGCGTPSGDLEDALPSGGEYQRDGDPASISSGEDIEESIIATYTGPNGETHLFGIAEFSSADAASTESENVSEQSQSDGATGFIVVKKYVYFGYGPDEESVEALMAEAEPLSSGCVDENVEFV